MGNNAYLSVISWVGLVLENYPGPSVVTDTEKPSAPAVAVEIPGSCQSYLPHPPALYPLLICSSERKQVGNLRFYMILIPLDRIAVYSMADYKGIL